MHFRDNYTPKLFNVCLKFKFNWMFCVLSTWVRGRWEELEAQDLTDPMTVSF